MKLNLNIFAKVSLLLLLSSNVALGQTQQQHSDTIRVSAILPFFTQLTFDTAAPPPRKELRMRDVSMDIKSGIEWAAHRISDAGYSLELQYFDEVPDSLGVPLWTADSILGSDLVFGPLQTSQLTRNLRTIDRTGAEHIILTRVNDNMLKTSTSRRAVLPSAKKSVELLVDDLIARHLDDNILFLMAGGVDTEIENEFLNLFFADSLILGDSLRFDTIQGTKSSIGSLSEKIDFYDRNVIVTLASRRSRSMISNLQMAVQVNDSTEIYVYGHPNLKDLKFIDTQFLDRTRTTIPVSGMVNWTDSLSAEAIMVYRKLFGTDPSEFAVKTHDSFIDAFLRRVEATPMDSAILAVDSLAQWDFVGLPQPVCDRIQWTQLVEEGGYVNSTWELETYHMNRWCDTDTVPVLLPFVEPELDEEGFFIRD